MNPAPEPQTDPAPAPSWPEDQTPKRLTGLRGLSPLRVIGLMVTGVLSTALLAQTAVGVEFWENSPITAEMTLGLSVLPGLISPLVYIAVFRNRPQNRLGRVMHTLIIPILWGLLTAVVVGLQFFGLGVIYSAVAFTWPMAPIPLGETTLYPPAAIFWSPLIAAALRVIGKATLSEPGDRRLSSVVRRWSPLAVLLIGLMNAPLSQDMAPPRLAPNLLGWNDGVDQRSYKDGVEMHRDQR